MTDAQTIRVLFDVGHPAHVHLFRHAIEALDRAGHETLVTSREKEVTTELLDAYDIDHRPLSAKGTSTVSLAAEWLVREARLVSVARSFEPDVVVSHLNPSATHAAQAVGATSVVFNDDEGVTRVAGRVTLPFADVVCTPIGFKDDLGPKQRRYDGVHELAYLHPNRFEPDPEVLRSAGIDPTAPFSVLRFVSWGAHHDVGQAGLSPAGKRELVEILAAHGDVYVSAEGAPSTDLAAEPVPVAPEEVHHLLAFADLYAGDSQTMALEAGVLGTPSVRSNSFAATETLGHFEHLEREYGLVHSIGDEDDALATVERLATDPSAGERWAERRERLLADTIDVTGFVLDVVQDAARREYAPPKAPSHDVRRAI